MYTQTLSRWFYLNHDDTSLQSLLLKEGVKDVKSMLDVCQRYNREHPTEMWLIYDAQEALIVAIAMKGIYDKDEELLQSLEFEKMVWGSTRRETVGE